MFLTNRARESKNNKKLVTGQFTTSSESGDLSLLLVRPAFSFSAGENSDRLEANASKRGEFSMYKDSVNLLRKQSLSAPASPLCMRGAINLDYVAAALTAEEADFVPSKNDSKELEKQIKRCLELEAVNQQLNERLIQSELEKEDYMMEIELLKHELSEALNISSAMMFQEKSARPLVKNCFYDSQSKLTQNQGVVHKRLLNSAPQTDLFVRQFPEKEDSISEKQKPTLEDLSQSIKTLESKFVQELNIIGKGIAQCNTHDMESRNENSSCETTDERSLEEISFHLESFTMVVYESMEKLQSVLKQSFTENFVNQTGRLLRTDSSTSTSTASVDCSVLSETDEVRKQSLISELEDGVTSSKKLRSQKNTNSASTLQIQRPQSRATMFSTSRESPSRADLNDSAKTVESHTCFNSVHYQESDVNKRLDSMTKENNQLRREVIKITEELVDLKEHSSTLEAELKEQRDASVRCKVVERNLRRVQGLNRDLNNALNRKQKIISSLKTTLTNFRSEAKQNILHKSDQGAGLEMLRGTEICVQVDAVLEAEKCYAQMEQLLTTAQSERQHMASRLIALDGEVHSLRKKYSRNKRGMDAIQKENSCLKQALSCARSEITTLKTNLKMDTMKCVSKRRRTRVSLGLDDEILMKELVKTKIELAEMHGVVIQLRNELFKSRSILKLARSSEVHTMRV
eukprot:g7855.t1